MNKPEKNFRLVVDFSDKAVSRVRFRERDRNGKYVPIERPWGAKELAGLKLVAKLANLTSRGVADLAEACRTASAPRRRKLRKKRRLKTRQFTRLTATTVVIMVRTPGLHVALSIEPRAILPSSSWAWRNSIATPLLF